MAEQAVTPQRVREILSSFTNEPDKSIALSQSGTFTSPEKETRHQPESQTGSPGSDISAEVLSNRRTFSSFLNRVETFSPVTWFAKPPELCPLVCSRFGWENTEYDMLHCISCGANLCGLLPSKFDSKNYKKACEELVNKLLTAHEKFCALAVNPCPEAFLKLQLHDVEELRKSFQQRVAAIRASVQKLPELVYTQLETWGFAETHAAKFCAEEEMPESETQVITLAITGWTVHQNNEEIIICSMCRRQIGLWNFIPAHGRLPANGKQKDVMENGDNGDSNDESGPPSKMRKIEHQSQLDPISSHHAWCPWIAMRLTTEDAVTLLPISPPPSNSSSSSYSATSPTSTPAHTSTSTPAHTSTSTPAHTSTSTPASSPRSTRAHTITSTPANTSTPAPVAPPSTPASSFISLPPFTPCNNYLSPATTPVSSPGYAMMMDGSGDARGGPVPLSLKQPAWVMVVRLVAPGLLSQSRCMVQRVRQSSIVEGLHCIRKMLSGWSSEKKKRKADLSVSLSASFTTSPS